MVSFVDKYRPSSLEEVFGHSSKIQKIEKWAAMWDRGTDPLLLHGPAGSGKTSTAEALAKDFGWGTVEINASSARTKEDIEIIAQQMRSESISGNRQLFILDELDSLSGKTSLKPLLDILDDCPQPVIAIANEKWQVPDSIENRCKVHKFKVDKDDIKNALRFIINKEDIDISAQNLGKLATRNGIRDAINDLQRFSDSQDEVGWDERDTSIGNFKAIDNILRGKKYTGEMSPPDLVEWLDENVSSELAGVEAFRAYQALSEADKWLNQANETQNYTWWRYAGSITEEVAELRMTEPYQWIGKSYPQSRRNYVPKPTSSNPKAVLYRELKESEIPNFRASFNYSEFRNDILPILKNLDKEEKLEIILSESLSPKAQRELGVTESDYESWVMEEKEREETIETEVSDFGEENDENEEEKEEKNSLFDF